MGLERVGATREEYTVHMDMRVESNSQNLAEHVVPFTPAFSFSLNRTKPYPLEKSTTPDAASSPPPTPHVGPDPARPPPLRKLLLPPQVAAPTGLDLRGSSR